MSVRNMPQRSAVIVAMKIQNQYCSNICTFGICKEGPIASTVSFVSLFKLLPSLMQPKVNVLDMEENACANHAELVTI